MGAEAAEVLLRRFLRPRAAARELKSEQDVRSLARIDRFVLCPGTENPIEEITCYRWPGCGPRVLLIHGWGGKAVQFAPFIMRLREAGCEVIAYDAPAHGLSTGEFASGPAFARGAREVALRCGAPEIIIGHSLGAAAACISLDQGLTARQVCLLAPVANVLPLLEDFANNESISPDNREELFRLFQARYGPEVLKIEAIARNFGSQALIIHDPADRNVPIANGRALAKAWPGARLVEINGVGHWRILRARPVMEAALEFFGLA